VAETENIKRQDLTPGPLKADFGLSLGRRDVENDLNASGQLPADTEGLIRKAIAGDERAFAKVIRTYGQAILAKIRQFLYLHHVSARDLIVDDIVQAVLLRVWRYWRAAKPDPPRNPRAWFMRVTLTVGADELRKETRGPKVVSLDDNKDTRDPGEDSFLTTAPDPLSESVREAMRRLLSEREFRATSMCYLEGFTYEEAAEREGCTPRQIRYRVQTALAKLRDDLNPK